MVIILPIPHAKDAKAQRAPRGRTKEERLSSFYFLLFSLFFFLCVLGVFAFFA